MTHKILLRGAQEKFYSKPTNFMIGSHTVEVFYNWPKTIGRATLFPSKILSNQKFELKF
jgi:hypothetical protein